MVGPKPWTFGGFFWGVSVFLSRWLLPICSSTAASVFVHGHRVCSRASSVSWEFAAESYKMAEVVAQPRVAWWPRSWYFSVATQPIRSSSGGVSRVFHIPGPTPNLV